MVANFQQTNTNEILAAVQISPWGRVVLSFVASSAYRVRPVEVRCGR